MSDPAIHTVHWRERLKPLFLALMIEACRQPDLAALLALRQYLPDAGNDHPVKSLIAGLIEDWQNGGAFRMLLTVEAPAIAYGMVEGAMAHIMSTAARPEDIAGMLANAAERWLPIKVPFR